MRRLVESGPILGGSAGCCSEIKETMFKRTKWHLVLCLQRENGDPKVFGRGCG